MTDNIKEFAPVIVFAFNRLNALKNTISSLALNPEARFTELFVFVDGPRLNKEGEAEKVKAVQEYIKTIGNFKSITYKFSNQNNGLGPSIISGVTEIINQYGKAIVLEDDLILTENFLSFMNEGLKRYEKENKVFSICGYTNKVKPPKDYKADAYFCNRSSSWGWATWSDRWNSVDWQLKEWDYCKRHSHAFNRWGGSDCWHMLNDWHMGKNKSWAIRFCFAQFLQNKVSLFPIKSLVQNDGFNGEGTNCKKWSRFKCELMEENRTQFEWPSNCEINHTLYIEAMRYHSIVQRAISKLMYMIHQ